MALATPFTTAIPTSTESALQEAERRLDLLTGDLRDLREHIASIRADVTRNGEAGRPKDLLTIEDVAERLSVGMTTVHELVRSGRLFSVKIGRSRRIPASAFDTYLAELVSQPAAVR